MTESDPCMDIMSSILNTPGSHSDGYLFEKEMWYDEFFSLAIAIVARTEDIAAIQGITIDSVSASLYGTLYW